MSAQFQSKLFTEKGSLSIKLGSTEEKILRFIKNHDGKYINASQITKKKNSNYIGVERTTFNSARDRLINKGLIEQISTGTYKVTEFANQVLESKPIIKGRQAVSRSHVSIHKTQYILKLHDTKQYYEERLKELNPIEEPTHHPHKNFSYQRILKFDNATLVINKKSVMINIFETLHTSAIGGAYESFLTAVEYAESLRKIGLVGSKIILHDSHFAQVESILSQYLFKVDNNFTIELDDGTKYWIDHSMDLLEEETNSAEAKENVASAMKAIISGRVDLDDLPLLKHTVKELVLHSAHQSNNLIEASNKINALIDAVGMVVNANENTANGLNSITKILEKNMRKTKEYKKIEQLDPKGFYSYIS